jgi:hypothetical protein
MVFLVIGVYSPLLALTVPQIRADILPQTRPGIQREEAREREEEIQEEAGLRVQQQTRAASRFFASAPSLTGTRVSRSNRRLDCRRAGLPGPPNSTLDTYKTVVWGRPLKGAVRQIAVQPALILGPLMLFLFLDVSANRVLIQTNSAHAIPAAPERSAEQRSFRLEQHTMNSHCTRALQKPDRLRNAVPRRHAQQHVNVVRRGLTLGQRPRGHPQGEPSIRNTHEAAEPSSVSLAEPVDFC